MIPAAIIFYIIWSHIMNIKCSLKRALFRRILEKRKSDHPFLMEEAERYLLPVCCPRMREPAKTTVSIFHVTIKKALAC